MRSHVRVAVVGGGVVGASVAWHLAKAGWEEVMLLERAELTSGSTWHAAAGTAALTPGENTTRLHRYTFELWPRLEAETGQSCGFHPVGGLMLARTPHRLDDLKILHSKSRRLGIETAFLSPAEATECAPVLDVADVLGILHEPTRGHVDPNGVTHAFAKGARDAGAEVVRHCPVLETNPRADGGWDVVTPHGTIVAERVVNAAGLWAREVGALAGVRLPLMPVEHHYFVTDTIPEIAALERELPLIGDADAEFYMRQEGKGLLLGAYEDRCTHWAEGGTPADFGHELLPDDLARIERNLAQAIECVPVLACAGVKRVINGPMIFSPDLGPLLGPVPGLPTYWCACGVMTAFSQAGGIGRVLADWMIEGDPGMDVQMWDLTRFGDWADTEFVRARTAEMYATRFRTVFPYEERASGRPVRTRPAYEAMRAAGAVFGSSEGWEVPLWYAREGERAADDLTFRRPSWLAAVCAEARALRESAGLFDVSAYAKILVRGRGAGDWLDRILANRVPGEVGRTVLAPMLNERGRIAGDFTVTHLGPDEYLLVGAGTMERWTLRWWERLPPPEGVHVESRSEALAGLGLAGPNARAILARLADGDVSREGLPFLRARRMGVGPSPECIVIRLSFTGDLGYELWFPAEHQGRLLESLREAGAGDGLRLVGARAVGALRVEKSFPSWGRELSPDYTPFEAGIERFVKLDGPDFVGREAALRLAGEPPVWRRCTLVVDAADADPWGGEPVLRDGEPVGYVTSAAFGPTVGESIALAYLRAEAIDPDAAYAVDVIGERRSARLSPGPRFDPAGARMRA